MTAIEHERAQVLRDRIGRVGVWLGSIALEPAQDERSAIARIERQGYGAAWFGEGPTNREALSPGGLLLGATERLVIATGIGNIGARETAAARARELGRRHMAPYLRLPNYVNNLRALGYDDADFADGGSERLVDAIVAWGDEEAIAGRVREHLGAGADHVAIQAYSENA